ncbi:ArnT family glycosyltransferase [Flagellimonas zhangzhouensis]|uniref:4-amino-4-deoxy-L-arabinose transferase n=1 Tax=Flagellimonas zhangzhouensis TaxID=1073328 RepID=A0A1H2YGT9_9FLAO|nr:glycosyltransferase family 39 protein [Allomuricauda zhangzhouensis]SDQ96174.1 4-amino-4-deoxy-L-arabinose transferase [Allomuricauda zhangzhouensis]SDX03844.1 4-amino-4-deoxy-L-arabinose transferase [Allomuricauda zhangzhouensis]
MDKWQYYSLGGRLINQYDYLILFIVGLAICTSSIGQYPIYILDEARNSEAAREMLASGNFLSPFFNGELRTDKPPLHYFFMVLGYKWFGVNSFGARFFSGFFGALTLLATYWAIKRHLDSFVAWTTVMVLGSSLFFINEFHLAVPDPYLIFFVSVSFFSFYFLYKEGKWVWFFAMYGGIALGVLTKGPIAIVLPGLVIPIFLLLKKDFNWKTLLQLRPILGLLVVLLIAAPWYYLVHLETDGEWTRGFFLDHNLSRFGSEKEGHGGLFLMTPLYVILGMLPFSLFGIQSFVYAWRKRKGNDMVLFALTVSVVTILFFSISKTKLPNYPMPCYPFVGILIAHYFKKVYHEKTHKKGVSWSLLVLTILSILLPIAGYVALSIEKQFFAIRFLSLLLALSALASILGFHFYGRGKLKISFLSIAGGWLLTGMLLSGIIYPELTEKSPVSLALKHINEKDNIVVFKRFDSAFPINFKRTFTVFQSLEGIMKYAEENPETFIITNTRSEEDLKLLEGFELVLEQKALFEDHITRIYVIK